MKKLLMLLALPVLSLSLFSFAPPPALGVAKIIPPGFWQVDPVNAINPQDRQHLIADARIIYGILGEGDFFTEMRATTRKREEISNIKTQGDLQTFYRFEKVKSSQVSVESQDIENILNVYAP